MKTPRILVTCGGSATALSVLKGIRIETNLAAHVILGDCALDIAGRHLADDFIQLPLCADVDYLDRMIALAIENQIDMIIPIFDPEFKILAANRQRFEEAGIKLVISSSEAILACRDKWETFRFFARHKIPTPMTWLPVDAADIGIDQYPLIVKPRDGRASMNVFKVAHPDELDKVLEQVPFPLIQRDVSGKNHREVTIDTVSDTSGQYHAYCARYRDEVRAGQSYKGLTFRDKAIENAVRTICEALPIVGPSCMQCFLTPEGPVFFEINPRFGSATILSIRAGLNGPAFLAYEAAGLNPPPLNVRANIRMLRYWEEVIVDAKTGKPLATGTLR